MSENEEEGIKTYKIREMNWPTLKTDRVVLIVGRRGTGKSTLFKYILSKVDPDFDHGIAMAPTPGSLETFRQIVPPSCVYDHYDGNKIEQIVNTATTLSLNGKKKRVFVFLDDCMADKKIFNSEAIRNIHMNGRHYGIFFVNLVQYVMDLPKSLRSQIDYVFALRENSSQIKRNLYENFFSVFDSYEEFDFTFNMLTEDNGCMILDNTSPTRGPEECIFWAKANPNVIPKKLGNRNSWKLHYSMYAPPFANLKMDDPFPFLNNNMDKKAEVKTLGAPGPQGPKAIVNENLNKKTRRKTANKKSGMVLTIEKRSVDGKMIMRPQSKKQETTPSSSAPQMAIDAHQKSEKVDDEFAWLK